MTGDGAASGVRPSSVAQRELALPIAAVIASAALVDEAGKAMPLRDFLRQNALSLGLIGMGAAWLAVANRGALAEFAGAYAHQFVEEAGRLGRSAAGAALSAVIDE